MFEHCIIIMYSSIALYQGTSLLCLTYLNVRKYTTNTLRWLRFSLFIGAKSKFVQAHLISQAANNQRSQKLYPAQALFHAATHVSPLMTATLYV